MMLSAIALFSSASPLGDVPRPQELSLTAAADYHRNIHAAARKTELQAGHSHRALPAVVAAAGRGPVISPVAFGADPTGREDSSAAFAKAMAALLNHSDGSKRMASGIVDLGGRTMSLGGGVFLIAHPLQIPPMVGNVHLRDGTLRAAAGFPAAGWLIEVGNTSCAPKLPDGSVDHQASCGEFVTFSNMLFDASNVAAGGVRITMTMGATLISTFFIGFTQVGLQVNKGHEVMLADSWLAECYWSDQSRCKNSSSVAVQINGNDHLLSNVVVFDFAKVGVEVNGAANILSAVHTWNGGGVGITLGSATSTYGGHQNRLLGCYLDYNTLDMWDPSSTLVEATFFLQTHAVLHAVKGTVNGLTMRYNTFTTAQSVVLDGIFAHPTAVLISDSSGATKATRAVKSLWQKAATRWSFNLSSALLFPQIDSLVYSVTSDSPDFFQHLARTPSGATVVVETSRPVDATVTVEVAQAL